MDNRNFFLDEERFRNGCIKNVVDTTVNEEVTDTSSFKNLSID